MNTEDSLEKIKDDAIKSFDQYWNCSNDICHDCPSRFFGKTPDEHYGVYSCFDAVKIDLIERTVNVMRCFKEKDND